MWGGDPAREKAWAWEGWDPRAAAPGFTSIMKSGMMTSPRIPTILSRLAAMFSNRNKDAAPTPQPVMPAIPAAAPKRGRVLSAPSIISADMAIQGAVNSTGDIQIDGRLE